MSHSAGNAATFVVVIRADSGPQIGHGHVIRTLALARLLLSTGAEVLFAIRAPSHQVRAGIERTGAVVLELEASPYAVEPPGERWTAEAQRADANTVREAVQSLGHDVDLLVVDHYQLDAVWERELGSSCGHLLVIDDLADRPHVCDTLVDHNWYGPGTAERYDSLVPRHTTLLLGPRYALLHEDYARCRSAMNAGTWPPESVLVSFGGTDPTGETAKALEALCDRELSGLVVDVVMGTQPPPNGDVQRIVGTRPRTTLHVALPSLAPLLATTDLAIGASGAATWERLCLDVPALVTTTSTAQSGVTEALAAHAMTTWTGLGADSDVARYVSGVRELASHPRPRLSSPVDGQGARRVAASVTSRSPNSSTLGISDARAIDAPAFAGYDPGTNLTPRSLDGPPVWRSRHDDLSVRLTRPGPTNWILELHGITIGTAELRSSRGTWMIDVGLFDAQREAGLSTGAVELVVSRVAAVHGGPGPMATKPLESGPAHAILEVQGLRP